MTLLVGVLCSEGVVIGADSAATMGSLGQMTVRQPTVKVEIVRGQALIATSGPVGLGQRLAGEFGDLLAQGKIPPKTKPYKAMTTLRQSFLTHIAVELEAAKVAIPVVGVQAAQASAISATLLAMSLDGRPRMFQFDHQGAPEEATDRLPWVCLGSGQMIADPFMAFLRGIFWEDGELPTIAEGTFAVVWTLEQAIDVSPAYLAPPIRVFTLTQEGQAVAAIQLDETELQEHKQAVATARQLLKDWRRVDREVEPPPTS